MKGLKKRYNIIVLPASFISLAGTFILLVNESWLGWLLFIAGVLVAIVASIVFWLKWRCRRCDAPLPSRPHIFADEPEYCSSCGTKINWE